MKKRILSILLIICILLTMLPMTALAAPGDTFTANITVGGNSVPCTFRVLTEPDGATPGTVQLGNGSNAVAVSTGALTIPSSVSDNGNNYTVTAIGDYAFEGKSGLTGTLTIPAGVTTIGIRAFSYCSGFTGTLTLPAGVTTIGDYAFINCSNFTALELQQNSLTTTMGTDVFKNCTNLAKLVVPAVWIGGNSVTLSGKSTPFSTAGGSLVKAGGLTSVLGQAIETPTGGNGTTAGTAINWSINVANVSEVTLLSVMPVAGATAELYSNTDFNANKDQAIALTGGGATTAYIKVTSNDTGTIRYHAVTINRSDSDTTSPTITSGSCTLAASNEYIDVVFSEGVYGAADGTTALTAANLALTFTQNGGTATNAVISSVKKNDSITEGSASALTGGESTVRVFLTVTGTPNGLETIEIKPATATSVYDLAGNAATALQTSGAKTLNDKTRPTLVSATRTDDTHITVALSENSVNIAKANDGGFTVTETGTPIITYSVTSIAQGADASHVVLTVANMGISAKEGVTVIYTAGANGTVEDTFGNPMDTDTTGVAIAAWDTTSPTITSGSCTLAASNAYIDVVFSEGVYGAADGTTALTAAKLALTFTQNGGTATNAVISSIKKNDSITEGSASALTGGESTVRIFLTVTGTPNGLETIEIKPATATSVYDLAGNAVLNTQTTGSKTLNDKRPPAPTPVPTPVPTPIPTPVPTPDPVIVIINGVEQEAATAETKKVDDKTVTTVIINDKKIEERLKTEGNNAKVVIPVKSDSDIKIAQLSGQSVKDMEAKNSILEIKTDNVTYTLPASQINIDKVSDSIGKQIDLKDIKVNVQISSPSQDTIKIVENTANKNSYQIVVKPLEFNIICTSGSKTVEVSKFNGYVERTVAIPDGIDPSKIITGVVLNNDGTFSHVPTTIIVIDGKYYAKISSLTNSTYLIISGPKTFTDVEKHWAKNDVNTMVSRLIMDGIDNDKFDPNANITRGELADAIVRGLGLLRSGATTDKFTDVKPGHKYMAAITIATEYGLIRGYGDNTYRPDNTITRENAMIILARAMKIAGMDVNITNAEAKEILSVYKDASKVSKTAVNGAALCTKYGVFAGSNNMLSPKGNITKAETAAVIKRLLEKAKLI